MIQSIKTRPVITSLIIITLFALSFSPLFPTVSLKNPLSNVFSVRFIPLFIGFILLWITFNLPLWSKVTLAVLTILGLAIFLFIQGGTSFGEPHHIVNIAGDSMSPTYKNGAFLMTKVLVSNDVLRRDDVILFKVPKDPLKESVGRVIGLPGDIISVKEGVLTLNRKKVNEPYLPPGMKTNNVPNGFHGEGQEKTVSQNNVYVLGDNREKSLDSRKWGLVPAENIENKVIFCIWNCH